MDVQLLFSTFISNLQILANDGYVLMKFMDLSPIYLESKDKIDRAVMDVLTHGQYVFGPEVQALEQQLADYVGVKQAIAVASGTTALEVALLALGVGPGDEVITSSFSFFATAEVIIRVGAIPVWVDIDPQTYNIDPSLIEQAITPKTKAIMPVSLYGQPADMQMINAIAARHQLPVIEDGAQSFGAKHHGQRSGGLSTIGCTSFFPSKPLGCFGDGGACFTNDEQLAEQIRCLINHGQRQRYVHDEVGFNGRISSIQAAVLLQKLAMFDAHVAMRQELAACYANALDARWQPPLIAPCNTSVYAQYTVRVKDRQGLQDALSQAGIPTAIHYPKGMHQQPALQGGCMGSASLPCTEQAASEVLSLPFYPHMPKQDVLAVAKQLNAFGVCQAEVADV